MPGHKNKNNRLNPKCCTYIYKIKNIQFIDNSTARKISSDTRTSASVAEVQA